MQEIKTTYVYYSEETGNGVYIATHDDLSTVLANFAKYHDAESIMYIEVKTI